MSTSIFLPSFGMMPKLLFEARSLKSFAAVPGGVIGISLVAGFILAGLGCNAAGDSAKGPWSSGLRIGPNGALLKDGKSYRAVGINYFSAFLRRLQNPEDTTYRRGFAELAKKEIPFVRFAACGFWPNEWKLYLDDKEAYFRLLDDVIKAAEENHIGLIPSLFWHCACVPDLVGEPMNQWGNPESKTIAFMRQYTRDVVQRYRNSQAVWAWEFGNEYSLAADLRLPERRPRVAPDRGTPKSRGDADDISHENVVTACREFAEAVRQCDPTRPIATGHSLPRQTAQHLRTEGKWIQDTREEFAENLLAVTPHPCDMISVHIYPDAHRNRFGEERASYQETLSLCLNVASQSGKVLLVGEFGAPDTPEHGGPEAARRENLAIIDAILKTGVPLAALWNFDLPSQEDSINVTSANKRRYLLDVLRDANRRLLAR